MIILVALVIIAISFAFITYPLFVQRSHTANAVNNNKLRKLRYERDETRSMLREVENDFKLGNLSEEYYDSVSSQFKTKAASLVKDIDELNGEMYSDEDIEKQVQEMRRRSARFCPSCGINCRGIDKFCSSCGARLK